MFYKIIGWEIIMGEPRIYLMVVFGVMLNLNASIGQQSISIINGVNLDSNTMESVRAFAEKELYVPVVSVNVASLQGGDLNAIGKQAAKIKKASDACVIVLGDPGKASDTHLVIMTNEQVAVINVPAISTTNSVAYTRRLQRLTMRAAASLFGIGADPDPYCVMHDYKTLADLDRMGTNFSPPWGANYRKAAADRGLTVRPMFQRQKQESSRPTPPPAPSAKGN